MASTTLNSRDTFFRDLDWVHCYFCLRSITTELKYYLFECKAVSCEECIQPMRTPETKKINCKHCQKLVNLISINEKLPPVIRMNFEAPGNNLERFVQINEFQRKHRGEIIDRLDKEYNRLREYDHKIRADTQNIKAKKAAVENATEALLGPISKVISKQRLDKLLQMPLEQLDKLSFDEMVSGDRRPRRRYSQHSNARSDKYDSRSESSTSYSSSSRENLSSDDGIAQHFKQQLNISNDRRRSNYRQASNEMPHGHENVDHRSNQCRHSLGRTTPSEFSAKNPNMPFRR